MITKELIIPGKINNSGKPVFFMGEFNEFCKKHNGKKILLKIEVLDEKASPNLKGYYYNYVVPTLRKAIWENGERKTEQQTELFLRQISPVMISQKIEKGKYISSIRKVEDLTSSELVEHIEVLKQIAAEEYSCYIEDPK